MVRRDWPERAGDWMQRCYWPRPGPPSGRLARSIIQLGELCGRGPGELGQGLSRRIRERTLLSSYHSTILTSRYGAQVVDDATLAA